MVTELILLLKTSFDPFDRIELESGKEIGNIAKDNNTEAMRLTINRVVR